MRRSTIEEDFVSKGGNTVSESSRTDLHSPIRPSRTFLKDPFPNQTFEKGMIKPAFDPGPINLDLS